MLSRYAGKRESRLSPRMLMVLAAIVAVALAAFCAQRASARRIVKYDPGAHIAARAHTSKPAAKKPASEASESSKSGEPAAVSTSTEEASSSASPSAGDSLRENGLGSPLCRKPGGLSAAEQSNCETSDFVDAADPTGNYAFDVNINTGIANWSNDISATIQNFLEFGWIGLVALVHGILVMLEWCYSPGVITGATMKQAAHALHETQLTFTRPWMVLVLAIASVLALYHGLIRRRVAETLGQVLMMLAMMIGGLWVIVNPAGTVGVIGEWANSASLGTLSAITASNPESGARTLAEETQNVFTTVISGPWCYMEFGNENWCQDPKQRDESLEKAAKKIAAEEEEKSGCASSCASSASREDQALATSARLLKSARNNGELFLALPANQVQRNSVKTPGTLLSVLCGKSESADECTSNTASEAEFRSERGTGGRVIGLILIWAGALGMLLLFGFLAVRLLEAAIASLLYLLLAPAAVLAPALGDGGRAAFRAWGMRLLGAFIAKLIYSFLLGVVLLMGHMLMEITVLGWWAQWLLVSALWWITLRHRHKVLGFAHGAHDGHETGSMRWYYRVRMAQDVGRVAGWARHKLVAPPASSNRPRRVPPAQSERSSPAGSRGEARTSAVDPAAPARRPNEAGQNPSHEADPPGGTDSQDTPDRPAPDTAQGSENRHTAPVLDGDSESGFTEASGDDSDFEEYVTRPANLGERSSGPSDQPAAEDLETFGSAANNAGRAQTPAPSGEPQSHDTAPREPGPPRRDAAGERQSDGGSAAQPPAQASGRPTSPPTPNQHDAGAHKPSVQSAGERPAANTRAAPESQAEAKSTHERAPSSHGPDSTPPTPEAPVGKPARRTRAKNERQRSSRTAHEETPYDKLARQLRDHEKRTSPRRGTNPPPGGRNR
jgi:hypothetical protein